MVIEATSLIQVLIAINSIQQKEAQVYRLLLVIENLKGQHKTLSQRLVVRQCIMLGQNKIRILLWS